MAGKVRIEYSHLLDALTLDKVKSWQDRAVQANKMLSEKSGEGNDFLGWLDPAEIAPTELIDDVNATAKSLATSGPVPPLPVYTPSLKAISTT